MDKQMDEWTNRWTNGQTDGRMDKTDSIGPSGFQMETNNLKIIEISHRTQIKYIYIFWCRLSSLLSSNFMQNICQQLYVFLKLFGTGKNNL